MFTSSIWLLDEDRFCSVLEMLSDTAAMDTEAEILGERSAGLYSQMEALVEDNARRLQDQEDYAKRYDGLFSRYDEVKARLDEIAAERKQRQIRRDKILAFIETVRERDALLVEFDEGLFRATVEEITVFSETDVAVTFRDGRVLHTDTRLKRYAPPAV